MFKMGLFDWDGTLYDSSKANCRVTQKLFIHFGVKPPTEKEYRLEISKQMDEFYYTHGIPRSVSFKKIEKARKLYKQEIYYLSRIFDETKPTLEALKKKGLLICIVSANVFDNLEAIIKKNGLDRLIDRVYTGKKEKLFKKVLADFKMKAENAFYLDDTTYGLKAANEAGITAIGVGYPGGFYPPEKLLFSPFSDFLLLSLKNLPEDLEYICKMKRKNRS